MKPIKLILFILITLSFITCKKDPNVDFKEGVNFTLHARKANYIWADNLRSEIITIKSVSGPSYSVLKKNSSVKLSEYMLGFSTCNVDVKDIPHPEYQQNFESDNYNPLYASPYMVLSQDPLSTMEDDADPEIKNRLKEYLTGKNKASSLKSQALIEARIEHIDYRTTPLKNIKITCSQDLFGIKAGEALTDYFVVQGYPIYHDFIITSNKQLVSGKTTDISLSQYLSYQPMAPAAMYMQFKKGVSIPANLTVEFTVELELEGGKTISATTKSITLTP